MLNSRFFKFLTNPLKVIVTQQNTIATSSVLCRKFKRAPNRMAKQQVLHTQLFDSERRKQQKIDYKKELEREKDAAILLKLQDEAEANDMPIPGLPNPYVKPPPRCIICEHNLELDYKNVRLLSQFVSPYTGRIYGRQVTGLCIYMQKRVAKLVKRSRFFGLIPYTMKDPHFLRDPKLFDPFRGPFRRTRTTRT